MMPSGYFTYFWGVSECVCFLVWSCMLCNPGRVDRRKQPRVHISSRSCFVPVAVSRPMLICAFNR